MSTISSVGGGYSALMMQGSGMRPPPKPSAEEMSSSLFEQLDTSGKGYLEQSDFESAISSLGSDGASADEVFSALDSDADGKLTESELSSSLQSLADQFESEFQSMRMQRGMEGMGGMPPPPPPDGDEDAGLTEDQVSSMLEAVGSSDSKLSDLLSTVASNFEAADADGDGRVTRDEAMAYQQSLQTSDSSSSTSASASTSTDSSTSSSSSDGVMARIMQLAASYGAVGSSQQTNAVQSLLSVMA